MLNQGVVDKTVSYTGDKLRLTPERAIGIFKPTCDQIVQHLKTIFENPSVKGTDAILMVGGFSESKMLQIAIKENFRDKRIIIPEEAGLAVLKGAVIFGHNPSAIVARRAKFTYGTDICKDFDQAVHELKRLTIIGGMPKCGGIFDKHVEIDQKVNVGMEFKEKIYTPVLASSTRMGMNMYTSNDKNPKYVSEDKLLGKLSIQLLEGGIADKEVAVTLKYGETELGVSAKVVKTGQVVKATFNFLG